MLREKDRKHGLFEDPVISRCLQLSFNKLPSVLIASCLLCLVTSHKWQLARYFNLHTTMSSTLKPLLCCNQDPQPSLLALSQAQPHSIKDTFVWIGSIGVQNWFLPETAPFLTAPAMWLLQCTLKLYWIPILFLQKLLQQWCSPMFVHWAHEVREKLSHFLVKLVSYL